MALNPAAPSNTLAGTLDTITRTRREGGVSPITETYQVATSQLATWYSGNSIALAMAHPTFTAAKLSVIEESQGQSREITEVRLTFEVPEMERGGGMFSDKPIGVYFSSSTQEDSVELDPTTAADEDAIKAGKVTKPITTAVFTRTEIIDGAGWAWTEANIISNINVIQAPTGMATTVGPPVTPTVGAWKKTGRNVQQDGSRIVIVDEWTYRSIGWTAVV
jgi:hypothetical protein